MVKMLITKASQHGEVPLSGLRRAFLCTETSKTTLVSGQPNDHKEGGLRKQGQQRFLSHKNQRFSISIIKSIRFHLQKQDILCRQQVIARVKRILLSSSFDEKS